MYRTLIIVGLLCSIMPPLAKASNDLIASYEKKEMNDLTVTPVPGENPTLEITRPWPPNRGGLPFPTNGTRVLKLHWTSEPSNRVAIRHEWDSSQINYGGETFLLLDVYIATSDALPLVMGIYDENLPSKWLSAACVPPTINEWYTISIYVGNEGDTEVGAIGALVFDQMPGTSGTIYIDNLRFGTPFGTCDRMARFKKRWWSILRSEWRIGAGPNCFTGDPDDVFVDENGHLHLGVVRKNGPTCDWYASEAIGHGSFGYGKYVFTVESNMDWDDDIILGLFTYDRAPEYSYREIDFEFNPALQSVLGCPHLTGQGQYAIQPSDCVDNLYRFPIPIPIPSPGQTTHVMKWSPTAVEFISYYGKFRHHVDPEDVIARWTYSGPDNPPPPVENVRMNFYLRDGVDPLSNQDEEIVVSDFRYLPTWMGRGCGGGYELAFLLAPVIWLRGRRRRRLV